MRLIDAGDAYIVLVDEYHLRSVVQSYSLMETLDKVPTVDAMPVVRCRDCKWMHDSNCIKHGIAITDDFFCADGERRD